MTWIVARTHPNAEKMAVTNLLRQDFDYYQPKILERKLHRQKIVNVEQPLFPCYLFVKVESNYRSLQYTYGIAALINGNVKDCIINDLRNREMNGYIQLPKDSKFVVGDKVNIKEGVFAGQSALVERMPAKDRQKVLLALLANKITVLVDESSLEVA